MSLFSPPLGSAGDKYIPAPAGLQDRASLPGEESHIWPYIPAALVKEPGSLGMLAIVLNSEKTNEEKNTLTLTTCYT